MARIYRITCDSEIKKENTVRYNLNLQHPLNSMSALKISKKTSGFTLIELVIVVAIIGIIATIAIPAYDSQKRKSYRSDAVILLTTAAQMQERLRTENGAYNSTLTNLTPTGVTKSPKGKYQLGIENNSSDTYTMTATAISAQAADSNCNTFKISHTGVKTAFKADGTPNIACWPK